MLRPAALAASVGADVGGVGDTVLVEVVVEGTIVVERVTNEAVAAFKLERYAESKDLSEATDCRDAESAAALTEDEVVAGAVIMADICEAAMVIIVVCVNDLVATLPGVVVAGGFALTTITSVTVATG